MTVLTFVNALAGARAATVEFRLRQGAHQVLRLAIAAGGHARVPVSATAAQAFTRDGDVELGSNVVPLAAASACLRAQVRWTQGLGVFELVAGPGRELSTLTCENTWRSPVELRLARPGSPFQITAVVAAHGSLDLGTAPSWRCQATSDGVTCAEVAVEGDGATITAVAAAEGLELKVG